MKRRTFLKAMGFGGAALTLGGFAFRVGGTWWDQDPTREFDVLSEDEVGILQAIADAMFPGDEVMPNGTEVGVPEFFDHYLTTVDERTSKLLRVLLHAIDDMAVFADFGRTRFRHRPREERSGILRAWDTSYFSVRRGAFRSIKLLVSTAYCEDPDVLSAAGINYTCGGVA